MTEVTIRAADGGSFSGYLAMPRSGTGQGILVIQEIFGVNQVMRGLADGFAAQGYVALCPDLFWRQAPGIQITDQSEAEWKRAFELYQGFDETKGITDLQVTLAFMRGHPACGGKVATVGYCLGGKLAFLMATRSDAECNVGYYGVGIDKALDEAARIAHPLLLHIAEKDEYCPPQAQQAIVSVLGKNKAVTIHTYPGVDHAFARVGGQHYDKAAAESANRRTADFLKQHLGA